VLCGGDLQGRFAMNFTLHRQLFSCMLKIAGSLVPDLQPKSRKLIHGRQKSAGLQVTTIIAQCSSARNGDD
jgi:hypothetical protein